LPRMEILVIAPRFPWPLEKGDKLRLFQQIRHLSRAHAIHLFALSHQPVSEEALAALRPYCRSLAVHPIALWRLPWNLLRGVIRGLPFSVAYFTDTGALRHLDAFYREVGPDLVYAQLARSGEYLARLPHPRVIDLMDAFSAIAEQRARLGSWWLRPFLRWESLLLAAYERRLARITDRQVFIAARDRQLLDPAEAWPALIVPNGIDTEYFQPQPAGPDQADLVFVGNLGYFPNVAAARYLVRVILPLIWKTRPATSVLIAGARPAPAVRALAGDKVRVEGWLPDIRTAYAAGRIFVAPLFQGAGQQNKILEAMAMGIPVITTSHVRKGIHSGDGEVLILADAPQDFAEQILTLLEDPQHRADLARKGLQFISENHSWTHSVDLLDLSGFQPLIQPL
jgi:polysaccharide biosynthesis protein PslH